MFLLGVGDQALDATDLPPDRQLKLAGLCEGAGNVTCSWENKSVTRGLSQPEIVGSPVKNKLNDPASTSVSVSIQKSYSSTLKGGVKAGFDLFTLVKAVSVEYSKTWTDTYTNTQTVTVPVAPRSEAWVEAQVPVDIVRGTLIVKTPPRSFICGTSSWRSRSWVAMPCWRSTVGSCRAQPPGLFSAVFTSEGSSACPKIVRCVGVSAVMRLLRVSR